LDINGEHPAPFPEEIITLPILQTSKEFELILDPFMGSGTTGRVCDKLGRSYVYLYYFCCIVFKSNLVL
jgi:DNA modification methylase